MLNQDSRIDVAYVLRGLAIVGVILFHAFPRIFPNGFLGVDVFFVVSGFLISSSISRTFVKDGAGFYGRRLQRLFPSFAVVIAITLVAVRFDFLPDEFDAARKTAIYACLGASNIHDYLTINYFSGDSLSNPFHHLWSLGTEIQFYLIAPFLVLRNRRMLSIYIVIIIGLISFTSSALVDAQSRFYLMPFRLWEFTMGIGVFFISTARPWDSQIWSVTGCIGLFLVLGGQWRGEIAGQFLACAFTSLFLLYGDAHRRIFIPLCYAGKISYPLYLVHWPFLCFACMDYSHALFPVVSAIIISVCVGSLVYHYIESPILGRKVKVSPKVLMLLLLLLLMGCISLKIGVGNDSRWAWDWADWSSQDNYDIGFTYRKIEDSNSDAPRILVIGDSHAESLTPALEIAARKAGITLAILSRPGTPPVIDVSSVPEYYRHGSDPYIQLVRQHLSSAKRYTAIFFISHWSAYLSNADFIVDIQRSVDYIGSSTPVFLVEQVPELPFDGKREVTLNKLYPNREHQELLRSYFLGLVKMQKTKLQHVTCLAVDSGLFDETDHLILEVSGEPTYSDSHHLTAAGAKLIVPEFSRLFKDLTSSNR